ncbi:MAG: crossover junction endodeoxyribonuclease RuvC [Chloroflexi bacterium]|jgi:crossover junction endodeoxyribonuclease RuvC|nr:MAG: crossover junction endodeoxyribonuclease RuvC [Chloroflexota bacterium]
MRILGVDPGTINMGVGVIELIDDSVTHLYSTTLKSSQKYGLPKRLSLLLDELAIIVAKWKPDSIAIEHPFVGKNIKSALAIGQAQALAMIVAAKNDIELSMYSPSEVKKSVTDYGGSSKEQVRDMVNVILELNDEFMSTDSSDSLAVALCHYNAIRFTNITEVEFR